MPSLTRHAEHPEVLLLDLGDGENRFSPEWVTQVAAALEEATAAEEPRALVTTATGKTWSQGLDLDWVGRHPDQFAAYVESVHALLATALALPVPCVAAVQGHCYAAGAMLALAHDQRVMRADRGFFCLPEVDIRIPFTPGMSALIVSRLAPGVAHEAMTTGRRYGGAEALAKGIVDAAVPEDEVVPQAVARALALADKHGGTLGAIKAELYERPLGRLRG